MNVGGKHPQLTQRLKKRFLEHFEEGRYICAAAKATPIDVSQVWRWRQEDEEFCKAFDATRLLVEQHIVAKLEAEADRRAVTGTLKPIYQGGLRVGEVREFSDTLLIFRLKGLAPDRYRERIDNTHSGTVTVVIKEVEVVKDYGNNSAKSD